MTDIRTRRRQAILDAALDEFCRIGFDSARMDAIAARAGIGKSTIYEYFPSKLALLEAVGEKAYAEVTGAVQRILAAPTDFRTKLVGYLQFFGAFFARAGELVRTIGQEHPQRCLVHELAARYFRDIEAALQTAIAQAQAAGELRGDIDRRAAASMLLSLPGPYAAELKIEPEILADLLLGGLAI